MSDDAPPPPDEEMLKVLYPASAIAARVAELGAELERHYRDKAPVVLPVMTGALPFAADLIRAIRPRVKGLVVECVRAKSYFATSEVRAASVAVGDVGVDVRGRHVLLVEDIVDTGHTMEKLKAKVLENGAATVAMVSLLNKRARRVTGTQPEFAGFDCDDRIRRRLRAGLLRRVQGGAVRRRAQTGGGGKRTLHEAGVTAERTSVCLNAPGRGRVL